MKISTKGRYGIRFLAEIAGHFPKSASIAEVAERQRISAPYLGQIAIILKRAGYIHSLKGSSGGFLLSKTPAEIRVYDVLRDLEGELSIVNPPSADEEENPFRKALRTGLYQKIDEAVFQVLNKLTLADLTAHAKEFHQLIDAD